MPRVAVVTGGMGGLGEAICMKLAKMGYEVVATYSPNNQKHTGWLAEMQRQGYDFRAVPVDVTDYESCQKAVAQITKDLGPVDVLDPLPALSLSWPGLALALAVLMFSLAGLPPMVGFFAKFFVFKAAVDGRNDSAARFALPQGPDRHS